VVAIRRWDPLKDLLELQERMNRLFEDSLAARLDGASLDRGSWIPLADVYQTADAVVVEVELPGVDEDEVELQLDGNRLTLRGQRRLDIPVRPDCFHRMERSFGSFTRTLDLPWAVETDRVKAQLRDGVLRLDLPRARSGRGGRPRDGE
jgi:HSP20 family protein